MKKRALLSVSDKTGLAEFAGGLIGLGYELVSTGGTQKALKDAGLAVLGAEEVTGFAECLDGRVKTLHPAIHAGLLAVRDNPEHMKHLCELGLDTIDIVVVNLYPFRQTILKPGCTHEEAIENIDIGGPAMLRSAAKNYRSVIIATDPSDYDEILLRLKAGSDDHDFRLMLSYKVYAHTAAYDSLIADYMRSKLGITLPDSLTLSYTKAQGLRYGENPHQTAAYYHDALPNGGLASGTQLHGKELSYNNIADANAALLLLAEFDGPAVVAIKHANPCGVAVGKDIADAYGKAYRCDPVSIFGGIVACNREVDASTASAMTKTFLEIITAPSFSDTALKILTAKPNLRLVKIDIDAMRKPANEIKMVKGGLLVQGEDNILYDDSDIRFVTKKRPTPAQLAELKFAFAVVKHAKSNAIVVAKGTQAVGVGSGQTNRIWAAKQAIERAGVRAKGAVLASDAFFPFDDCVTVAAEGGIAAIVQPGGSAKDADSIAACDKHGIAMIMVGKRHFRH